MHQHQKLRQPVPRSDEATAAVIEQAQRLCASDGIDSAIRYMEARQVDRTTILRVLCSPRYHRGPHATNSPCP